MSKIITIPKAECWKLNEGHYHAKVIDVTYPPAKRGDENCVIRFKVEVPGMERYECRARAVFGSDFTPGSKLRVFLEGLLGATYFEERSGQAFDMEAALKGMDCEIELKHGPHNKEKFDWPMVLVTDARPARIVKLTKEQLN